MKTSLWGIVFLLFALQLANAQKSPIKFGVIPPDDVKMTYYDKDSTASAVVLSDYGEAALAFYVSTVKLNFERHVRIKILKKEGLAYADVEIPLYHSGSEEEKVIGLKATTYNLENGRIVETDLSKDGVFKEKFNKFVDLQKFTMPNVKEGSIIEYSYTISSPFIFNFPDWEFQRNIPTRASEFWAILPDFLTYQKYMQGYLTTGYEVKPKQMGDYQAQAHHFYIKGAPAFKPEPFMTSEKDYMSKINFAISHINFPGRPVIEIMGSWEKLCKTLNEDSDFGGAVEGNGFLKKYVEEVTAGMTDNKEKAKAIYNFVKTKIEWDGTKDVYAGNLKKVLELGKGTAGDMNITLASMLSKAGFVVDMVLLSTRDHGFVRQESPMAKQFNYTICRVKINDEFVLLDATEKLMPFGIIPDRCLNGQGLLVSKINRGWIDLTTKTKAKTVITSDMTLAANGELRGKLNFSRDGYAAFASRQNYFQLGEEKFAKNFTANKVCDVESSKFENMKEIDKPAIESYQLVMPSHASVAADQIYINPFVTDQIIENPFKHDERIYPVDFKTPSEQLYMAKFTIPEGYTIDEIPQNKMFMLPGNAAKFVYSFTVNNNVLSLVTNLQINRPLFIQTEYELLKEFYNQIVAKESEQIVLKKIK